MLSRTVRVKLTAFVIVGLLATSYLAVKYLGVGSFGGDYRVSVQLPEAGGLFENGEVTYRGVPVGRVESLRATRDGVKVVLRLDGGGPDIPADVDVAVVNRSAIGEQYLQLAGEDGADDLLKNGDWIDGTNAVLPPPMDDLLFSTRNFLNSVPKDDLATVIDEVYEWTRDGAEPLRQLNTTLSSFAETAQANFVVTSSLIRNSGQVLDTQLASQASIKAFSRDLAVFAKAMEESDTEIRKLIENTPQVAREFQKVIQQVGGPLGELMANLVTPAQVFGVNAAGVRNSMINLPDAMSIGWAVTTSQGLNLGLAQTYFDPAACTSGYGGTQLRPGVETSKGQPFNTMAGCTAAPSTGTGVRGTKSLKTPRVNLRMADDLGQLMGR
ncbi:MlaD family protein [Nocardioides sp. Bht2]|uniref:MlaD family protein n=1 Tax=Nocardioides sp. Bht2 TaxID=3392297 RepID=UPI0039B62194